MRSRVLQLDRHKPRLEELETRLALSGNVTSAVQTSMGTYSQVAGAIPSATSSTWFDWYNTLESARLNYSLQPRAQTFYFSASGNDTTGDGSQANPWQSLSQARTVLTQTGGNVALLFKRGDEFDDTVGFNVTQPYVTIGAWGDSSLPIPLLSAFTIKYTANSNVWTQVAGTNTWSTSAPNLIGWIRDATNDVARLSPFTYLQTSSAVGGVSRSWTWLSGTLYLNPGTGVDPNTINWEAVGNNSQCGIIMGGDGGLITDIRTDGWGCVATQKYESWGIVLDPVGTASVVAMNCASFYNGIHGIGTMSPSSLSLASGGFSLLLNNVSGYTDATAAATTVFIFFSPRGSNEVLSQGNTVEFGQLPDFNLIGGGADTQSQAFYGHTGGQFGEAISLAISMNDQVTRQNYLGATYSTGGNNFDKTALPGTNATLSTLRHFVVNYQVLTNVPYTVNAPLNTVQMNCLYQVSGTLPASDVLNNNGGWFINCIWNISDPVAIERYFVNAYSAVPTLYILDNSFLLDGAATAPYQTWDIVVNSGANSNATIYAANNVFASINNRNINLNIRNDAQHLLANAYYNVNSPSSYNGDPFGVVLTSAPSLLAAPLAGSPLIGAAETATFGYTVNYDFYGHLRNLSAPTLGAIEFNWNALPITDAGQYYIVQAGQSLVLAAQNPRNDAIYSWDVNGDGVYGDAMGANPTLTWSQLLSLGIRNGSYSVRLQTTLGSTVTYSGAAYLQAVDRAPSANAGSAQTVTQGNLLNLDASKSFSFTPNEPLTYSWDINGDGVYGDAVGVNPKLNYTQLAALGLRGGYNYNISVRVSQAFDPTMYSTSSTVQLTYKSVPLIAKGGGPYTIAEGQSLVLNGTGSSDSLGLPLNYSWDVNGDGTYGDAVGVSPTLTWTQLQSLGIVDGTTTRNIKVQVTDGWGRLSTSAISLLTVNNAAPVAGITGIGPVVRAETVTYTLTANDPSNVDQAAGFNFKIDWDNDGIVDQTVVGASGTTVTHIFSTLGTPTIRVTATDKDNGVSSGATFVQSIVEYALRANGGVTDLIWGGSTDSDSYTFSQEAPGLIHIFQFDPIVGDPATVYIDDAFVSNVTGALRIYGGAGDDSLVLMGVNNAVVIGGDGDDGFASIAQPAGGITTFDGGNGNDQFWSMSGDNTTENFTGGDGDDFVMFLSATHVTSMIDLGNGNDIAAQASEDTSVTWNVLGGAGNDLILGGVGSDTIDGGAGNDFIVGDFDINNLGGSADLLIGGDGNDVIIGHGGADSINGGNGQDLIIAGKIAMLTYFPQSDEPIPYQGYQQVWDIWNDGASLATRQAQLQGTSPSFLESQYYLQPGTTMLDDGAVDTVLGGDDEDWLIYDFAQDNSDYTDGTDLRTNI